MSRARPSAPSFPSVPLRSPAALALGAALLALSLAGCSKKEAAPEPVRAVRTQVVGLGSAASGQEFAAEIRARTESRLGFRVGGKLQSRPVNAGDTVRAGQVLAQLDPLDLRLGQDAAQAAVQAAQSSYDLAVADLKRYRDLREQGFIGAAELERRDSVAKSAKAQLDQAQAQLHVQRNQSAYTSLVADVSGVITAVEAEPGQVLAAGTPVLRLAADGPRDAVFSVPEDRVGAIRALIGKAGAATLQAWGSSDSQPVTIHEVAAAADPVTRTFQVKADIGKSSLRLGQTATVRVAGPARSDVIRLPLNAVLQNKGDTVVWLLDPQAMQVRAQPVQVGGADGNTVLISGGLKTGDEVVIAGTHVLTPEMKVKRYVEPGAAAAPAAAASR